MPYLINVFFIYYLAYYYINISYICNPFFVISLDSKKTWHNKCEK